MAEELNRENLFHDRRVKLPSHPEREVPTTTAERVMGSQGSVSHRANPQNVRSAYGFHSWLGGRHSVSQEQLGALSHFDDQEALRGYTSYPEEHEWHPANRRKSIARYDKIAARRESIANYQSTRTGVDEDPVKRNTFDTTCAQCKQPLRAGEGIFSAEHGYKVIHEHGCEPKAGRPAGKPRTATWTA